MGPWSAVSTVSSEREVSVRSLSPGRGSGSEVEQYVIHTQRGQAAGTSCRADVQRVGMERRRAPGSVLGSPRRRQRGNLRNSAVRHGGPQNHVVTGGNDLRAATKRESTAMPVTQFAMDTSTGTSHLDEDFFADDLRRENEELRLQVMALREEQQYTAELHSQVIAAIVRERNDLEEQLQGIQANCEGKTLEEAPTATSLQEPAAEPQEPDMVEAPSMMRSEDRMKDLSESAVDEAEDTSVGGPEVDLNDAKPVVIKRYTISATDHLAEQARRWELQGAVQRALREKPRVVRTSSKPMILTHSPETQAPPGAPRSPTPSRATLPCRSSSRTLYPAVPNPIGREASRCTLGGGEASALLAAACGRRPPRAPGLPAPVPVGAVSGQSGTAPQWVSRSSSGAASPKRPSGGGWQTPQPSHSPSPAPSPCMVHRRQLFTNQENTSSRVAPSPPLTPSTPAMSGGRAVGTPLGRVVVAAPVSGGASRRSSSPVGAFAGTNTPGYATPSAGSSCTAPPGPPAAPPPGSRIMVPSGSAPCLAPCQAVATATPGSLANARQSSMASFIPVSQCIEPASVTCCDTTPPKQAGMTRCRCCGAHLGIAA